MAEITWIENRPVHIGNLVILVGHYPKLRSVSPRHTFLTPFKQHQRTPRTDTRGQRYHEGNYHKVIKLPLTGNTFNEDTPTVQEIPMGIAVLVTRIASLMDRLVTNRDIVRSSGGIDRGHKKWNMRLWWQILEQYDVLRSHWPMGVEPFTGLSFDEFNEFLTQSFPDWNQMGEETLSFPERRNTITPHRLSF